MTHVFVAPHPDDIALSCGGLIAKLRGLGQNVTILTVYSGTGAAGPLTPYQREALGFGTKATRPASEAFDRSNVAADRPLDPSAAPYLAEPDRLEATQAEADGAGAGAGALETAGPGGAAFVMATRRREDERFASFAEASIVWLDLPDAVFRGYNGDDALLGSPRPGDQPPVKLLGREIARLEPQRVYIPLAIGSHVDHQLTRAAGVALLGRASDWVMPGPDYAGSLAFYEDFPYAWWGDFSRLEDLPVGALDGVPSGVAITPEVASIGDSIDWKIRGIGLYASQLDNLFGGAGPMTDAVRGFGRKVAALGGLPGYAERYWVTARL